MNVGDFGQTRRTQSVCDGTTVPVARRGVIHVLTKLAQIGRTGSQDSTGSLADCIIPLISNMNKLKWVTASSHSLSEPTGMIFKINPLVFSGEFLLCDSNHAALTLWPRNNPTTRGNQNRTPESAVIYPIFMFVVILGHASWFQAPTGVSPTSNA